MLHLDQKHLIDPKQLDKHVIGNYTAINHLQINIYIFQKKANENYDIISKLTVKYISI